MGGPQPNQWTGGAVRQPERDLVRLPGAACPTKLPLRLSFGSRIAARRTVSRFRPCPWPRLFGSLYRELFPVIRPFEPKRLARRVLAHIS